MRDEAKAFERGEIIRNETSIGKLQPAAHFSKHDSVWRLVNHHPRVALNKCRKDLYCVRREPRVRRYL